jgi:hypothetical protein
MQEPEQETAGMGMAGKQSKVSLVKQKLQYPGIEMVPLILR